MRHAHQRGAGPVMGAPAQEPMRIVASAPGKVVLMGEYVVLEGAPALVMAVNRRARADFVPARRDLSARRWQLVAPTLNQSITLQLTSQLEISALTPVPRSLQLLARVVSQAAKTSLGHVPAGTLHIDTAAFFETTTATNAGEAKKLGLGSSAAVACAAYTALLYAAHQRTSDLAPHTLAQKNEQLLLEMHALHRNWQSNQGSGIDVAASTFGGLLRFCRPPGQNAQVTPVKSIVGTSWLVIFCGKSSDTQEHLAAFSTLKVLRPKVYWRHLETMAALSTAACEFMALGEAHAMLPVIHSYCESLRNLGQAMNEPVMTPRHEAILDACQKAGGAYKPSGAGGGDVGVAFCPNGAVKARVIEALRAIKAQPLDLHMAKAGACVEIQ